MSNQEKIEMYESILKGLHTYFAYANINVTKYASKHGAKEAIKFDKTLRNFHDLCDTNTTLKK
mgnify:CR=1 FL=1